LSPLDLIPDFIRVLGYLDDLMIVPLGIAVVLRLVPAEVLADCRAHAQVRTQGPVSNAGAIIVVSIWLVVATWLILAIRGLFA
jgi:uncharacterized membrane protein YkvA (DUF1232 family)